MTKIISNWIKTVKIKCFMLVNPLKLCYLKREETIVKSFNWRRLLQKIYSV